MMTGREETPSQAINQVFLTLRDAGSVLHPLDDIPDVFTWGVVDHVERGSGRANFPGLLRSAQACLSDN